MQVGFFAIVILTAGSGVELHAQDEAPKREAKKKKEEAKKEIEPALAEFEGDLGVRNVDIPFGETTHNAYSINIYKASEKEIEKALRDRIKIKAPFKIMGERILEAKQTMVPAIQAEPLDIYAKIETGLGKENLHVLSAAFISDSVAIGPNTAPEQHAKVEELMADLAVDLNRGVATAALNTERKALEKLEKDLQKVTDKKNNAEDKIRKYKEDIKKSQVDEEQNAKKLAKEKKNYEMIAIKHAGDNTKKLKKQSASQKKITKMEANKIKYAEDRLKLQNKITEAERDIKEYEQEIERLQTEVEVKQNEVAELQSILNSIEN